MSSALESVRCHRLPTVLKSDILAAVTRHCQPILKVYPEFLRKGSNGCGNDNDPSFLLDALVVYYSIEVAESLSGNFGGGFGGLTPYSCDKALMKMTWEERNLLSQWQYFHPDNMSSAEKLKLELKQLLICVKRLSHLLL
ncbi:hypothetical protein ACLOJK_002539 [Asimina triloba]